MTHPPILWQELARGMSGRGDVQAAQRGLWRAADDFGYVSRNARNGNYGQQTAVDVGRFREATNMTEAGSNDQIGAKLWPLLWPYIDASGRARFCDQPQSVTPQPKAKTLPLEFGDQSKGVEAAQRALWRALPASSNARNGNYGEQTAYDVERFRQLYKVSAGDDGRSIGGELWNCLTRWMDEYALELVDDWRPDQATPTSSPAQLALDIALAEVGYVEGAGNQTKYGSWYGMNGQPWCAQFVAWCAETHGSTAFAKGSRYAYVPYIVADAYAGRNGLRLVAPSSAARGDLACYDWEGDGIADHVGFVVAGPGAGESFHTVEGNTSPGTSGSQSNGGGVYERTRYLSDVVAFVAFS